MRAVLLDAFHVERFQLAAPDWAENARVEIEATLPPGHTRRDVPAMLQALLRERFGLVSHLEPRPLDVYELSVDKDGVTMAAVSPVEELSAEQQRDRSTDPRILVSETVDGRISNTIISLGLQTTTATSRYAISGNERRTRVLDAERMSMRDLASMLTPIVDQPVIDKTGLTGLYQFTVELPQSAEAIRRLLALGITTTVQGTPLTEPTGVSVFKAMESLGLRLERRRSPIDVVVIDKLNPAPTPN
jgi:uncharacterized protein (TIGR03435 family)